jgi:hypothetical protein
LVRWSKGWKYRGTAGSGTVSVTHSDYTVEAAVDQLVDAEIAEATDDENTVSVQARVVPRNGDDRPLIDFNVGDGIFLPDIDGTKTLYRCMSITPSEDQYGNLIYDIEANSLAEEDSLRQKRFVDLASPGSLTGRSDNISASDLGAGISFGVLSTSELGTFTQSGYLLAELDSSDPTDLGHSEWWPVDENPILLYRHPWALQQAGDTDTIIEVRYRHPDQSTIDAFPYTIKAGVAQPDDSDDDHASFYTNLSCAKGGAVQVACTQAGDFAYGLTFRTKYTSQT